ncbi:hypothetical protein [Peribacillus frigoritolerans]|nr:hypothetical protein [Peribacillus frigoritolerans]USK66275.1 hypothetical protein LIT26_06500 [Peribacillus frigoritolerans]
MKIEVNTQSNESLSHSIDRHEKLVKEYNEIIEIVEGDTSSELTKEGKE